MKKSILFWLTGFIFLFNGLAFARIINVPDDQPSIGMGIYMASDGDTVLVHPGVYKENIKIKSRSVTVASLFHTTGDESYISQTVIDGDGQGSVITFMADIDWFGEVFTPVIIGFTITNGTGGSSGVVGGGGGILCIDSEPVLENLIISNNSSLSQLSAGGGIYCSNSNLNLKNVTVSDNSTIIGGGGIYAYTSTVNLENVTISDNIAEGGAGIYCGFSDLSMKNVTISNNKASSYGGGFYCAYSSNPTLEHVTVSGNTAIIGAGILFDNSPGPDLTNVTISDNSASSYAGGILCLSNSSPRLVNSVVWNNTPQGIYFHHEGNPNAVTISYSDVQNGEQGIVTLGNGVVTWLDGNIDADPLFEEPDNYHLKPGSPCIDAGDPGSDYSNEPSPNGNRINIGRFGNTSEAATSSDPGTILSVNPLSANVPAAEGTTDFDISNTGTGTMFWSVSAKDEWFSVTQESGANNAAITVNYELNRGMERTAVITITAPGAADSPRVFEIKQVAGEPVTRKKAILAAGGGPSVEEWKNDIWDATRLCANYAYNALIFQGYTKENIYYLSPDTNFDVDGNGSLDDIDAEATLLNLRDAVVNWADDAGEVLIYMVDHGGNNTFRLNLTEILFADEDNTEEDLDGYLDALQENMSGRVIVVYDACESGSFIPRLLPPEGKKRIVITSSDKEEKAYFLKRGRLSFSYQFWASVDSGFELNQAYFFAKDMMKAHQAVLVDANGNGQVEFNEGKELDGIIIGMGKGSLGDQPFIEQVSVDPQTLNGNTSATIQAKGVRDANGIEEVWAVIVPPDFSPGSPDIPVTDDDLIILKLEENKGIYKAVDNDFTRTGVYKISVYAKDTNGDYSFSKQLTIVQTNGISFSKGDINRDGTVDLADAVIALKVLAGTDVYVIPGYAESGADVNGDGKIGLEDAVYVIKKESG